MLDDCTSRMRSCLAEVRGLISTSYRRTSAGGSRWLGLSALCTADQDIEGLTSFIFTQ